MLRDTFGIKRTPLEVRPVPGQLGSLALDYAQPLAGRDGLCVESRDHVAALAEAAILNMVAQRDAKHRLQVFDPRDERRTQSVGQLSVTPAFEWRLLRYPAVVVRPGPRATLLARVGPVPGLGPLLPPSGLGAEGFRLAVAMDLEAVQLRTRQGKAGRGSKSVRSWLVSWLPSSDALDLALLLTFWPKDMTLHEDAARGCSGEPAYSAIAVGQGVTVHFPEGSPLLSSDFQALREMHLALCEAHRAGSMDEAALPQLPRLREWGRAHLAAARVTADALLEPPTDKGPGKWKRYSHRHGFTTTTHDEAPQRRAGSAGGGSCPAGLPLDKDKRATEEVPPWDVECIVVPPPGAPHGDRRATHRSMAFQAPSRESPSQVPPPANAGGGVTGRSGLPPPPPARWCHRGVARPGPPATSAFLEPETP